MESSTAAFAFAALGQETRLDLLRALLAAGPSGLAAGDIAARLGVPPSTLSFHLRALDQAGLIAATRQDRDRLCTACFTGTYPIELPGSEHLGKGVLEPSGATAPVKPAWCRAMTSM